MITMARKAKRRQLRSWAVVRIRASSRNTTRMGNSKANPKLMAMRNTSDR
jgi:hypothetical protein